MSYKAVDWFESYLKSDMTVFEYGSGGSTLFFAKRVKTVVSIEHDRLWYDRVCSELDKHGISNCHLLLCEPEKTAEPGNDQQYTSANKGFEGYSFERYVSTIEEYPDASFDLALVDGRARRSCLSHVVQKVRAGGYVVLDDSDRQEYADAESLLDSYPRRVFRGLMPYRSRLSHTAVWKIEA